MSASVTEQFTTEMEPHRDRLYGLALALTGSPRDAERLLHESVHTAFANYSPAAAPDFFAFLEPFVLRQAGKNPSSPTTPEPMPAALWARIHAEVQIEAAKRGGIASDNSLLTYDPLLSPKNQPAKDDLLDGLNLPPTARFMFAAIIALVIGVVLTILLTTRHRKPATTQPALTQPAATQPSAASQPATQATTIPVPVLLQNSSVTGPAATQ